MDRRGSSISFAVIGNGDEREIFAFSTPPTLSQSVLPTSWTCPSCNCVNDNPQLSACYLCDAKKVSVDVSKSPRSSPLDKRLPSGFNTEHRNKGSDRVRARFAEDERPAFTKGAPEETSFKFDQLVEGTETKHSKPVSDLEMNMSFAKWSISDNMGWTCPSCTYMNENPLHLTCVVCGMGRTKEAPSSSNLGDSIIFGQGQILEKQRSKILDLEQKAIEKERMNELIDMQFQLLDEIREENERKQTKTPQNGNTSQNAITPTRRTGGWESLLDQSRMRLELLERMQREEKEDQDLMEEFLEEKRRDIEDEEGMMGRAQTHSTRVLQWKAQERMLQDWRRKSEEREKQLDEIRRKQRALHDKYQLA